MWDVVDLTDGITTLNLTDGIQYALKSYVPVVAPRRAAPLGGTTIIDDVEEPLIVDVLGQTPALAQSHLRALNRLLGQAVFWYDDDLSFTAVRIRVLPQCSAKTTPYEACLVMTVGDPLVTVPEYDQVLGLYVIPNVTITIRRRGQWLNETDTASSSAVSTGALWSVTLPTHDEYSPVDVFWNLPNTSNNAAHWIDIDLSGLVMSDSTIQVWDSASFVAPTAPWSTIADANAVGGSVVRLAPAIANTFYVQDVGIPTALQTAGTYLILAAGRLSPAADARTWSIYLDMLSRLPHLTSTGSPIRDSTAVVSFSTVATLPVLTTTWMLPLGIVSIPEADQLAQLRLLAAASDVSGTPQLDIDYLVVARIVPSLTVINLLTGYIITASGGWGTSQTMVADIHERLTSHMTPEIRLRRTSGTALAVAAGYQGDLATAQKGAVYNGVWIGGNTAHALGNQGVYRIVQQPPAAAGTLHTTAFTVTRRRAYLVPE